MIVHPDYGNQGFASWLEEKAGGTRSFANSDIWGKEPSSAPVNSTISGKLI